MAGKSLLLFLALIMVSVFAAAQKPKGDGSIKEDVVKPDWNMEKSEWIKPKSDVIKPNNLAIGLIGIPSIPLPGADGGFHFQLGPIGFGFNMGGGLQFGDPYPGISGSYPGQPMPPSQPYVVVPPYSQLYVQPTPYPYMGPNQQFRPRFDLPHHGSYDPIPSPGDKAPGSFQNRSPGSPGTSN